MFPVDANILLMEYLIQNGEILTGMIDMKDIFAFIIFAISVIIYVVIMGINNM